MADEDRPDEGGSDEDLTRKSGIEDSGAPCPIFAGVTLSFHPGARSNPPAPCANHTAPRQLILHLYIAKISLEDLRYIGNSVLREPNPTFDLWMLLRAGEGGQI